MAHQPATAADAASAASSDPWHLEVPEPTSLVGLWPEETPPERDRIVRFLVEHFGGEVQIIEELEPTGEDSDIAWGVACTVPGIGAPVVLWVEPARDPDDALPETATRGCGWVVGTETILDETDPLREFGRLMQIFACALTDVSAVLDINTTRWYLRDTLHEMFSCGEMDPPAEVLWVIEAVETVPGSKPAQRTVWLHTHGLWRCGAPELELLEVPSDHAQAAADLLNGVAALSLEGGLPAPGAPYEVGTGLSVSLQPWDAVAPFVPPGAAGGMSDREEEHAGARAVICAAEPQGAYRKLWVCPIEIVQRLARDEAGVYLTERATKRQARLARAEWGHLRTAFEAGGAERTSVPVRFGVKAGFPSEDDSTSREHLWFEITQFDDQRVEACLVNQPLTVKRLSKGDVEWIERDAISDWRVVTPYGAYGPSDLEALGQLVERLREDPRMTVPEELPEPRPEDLVLLRTEETRFEAGVLVAVLESAGIEAVVMDSSSPTEGVAFRPPASGVPVSVRYADIEAARAAVARYDEDTVDLDWDEVDVGSRADDLPLTPLGHLPSAARLAFIVAVITLVVGLVGVITVLLMG